MTYRFDCLKPLLVVAVILPLSACSTFTSWWNGDESEDVGKVQQVSSRASGKQLQLVWQTDLDQRRPASPSGFSIPLVIDTKSGKRVVAGAQDRRVRIYDMDGNELSRIALGAPIESGALQLSNGLVVIGDVEGVLYGIDLVEGQVAWRYSLSSLLMSAPVTVGEGFIVQTADNRIYRFTEKGEKLWSYIGSSGGMSMHLSPSPVMKGERIYAVLSTGDVVALKADTGSFLWKKQLLIDTGAVVLSELNVPVSTPVIIPAAQSGHEEDMLVVAIFQGELVFISLRDGSDLIHRKLSMKSSPILIDKKMFVADASGAVSALDVSSGETWWRSEISAVELAGPVIWQNSLWVADEHGEVYRLSLEGELLQSIDLPGRIDLAPIATAEGVFVRNDLGTLFMLR